MPVPVITSNQVKKAAFDSLKGIRALVARVPELQELGRPIIGANVRFAINQFCELSDAIVSTSFLRSDVVYETNKGSLRVLGARSSTPTKVLLGCALLFGFFIDFFSLSLGNYLVNWFTRRRQCDMSRLGEEVGRRVDKNGVRLGRPLFNTRRFLGTTRTFATI